MLPGTVTSMLKTLDESNLATYTPYEGVRLTSGRAALALRVLRRHRLIELFLGQTLNLDLGRSPRRGRAHGARGQRPLVDRIDAFLGYPGDRSARRSDSQGRRHRWRLPPTGHLSDCAVGERFRIARVIDQSSDFLRHLSKLGLEIGTHASLVSHDRCASR